jgi:hypothetical protein
VGKTQKTTDFPGRRKLRPQGEDYQRSRVALNKIWQRGC